MQITKNADTSKYHYKGYGICFEEDMSFSKHANNKAKNIYVMGKDYVQKINDTKIYAEKMYYRNFTYLGKKFMLSLHYNGDELFVC